MNRNKYRSLSLCRVVPRLVRMGVEQTVTITPMGVSKRFNDEIDYTVSFVPMEIYDAERFSGNTKWDSVTVRPVNGEICVSYTFDEEQEWILSVTNEAERESGARPLEAHIYSLADDLYDRNPYMGDLHVHSCRSDGKEDPAIVAANYRKEGFDFFALTDHHRWWPSQETIDAYAEVPLGIKLFHGEEVHVPTWIHIVNFGSEYSVNELYKNNAQEITAKVEAEAEQLQTPKGVNALEYAWRKWIAEEIRKAGGLCIVPHPYWICKQTYNMSSAMLDYVFETGAYDAFELVGGQSVHENNVQSAFYQEQRAKGRRIPIVGSSDSHGTDPASYFGLGKTIVFAKDMELDSICSAIKDMYSVAIEQQPGEDVERVFGSYRLVKYARFLLDQYFPAHNELCVEEGILMREFVLGDEDAAQRLTALANRTDRYMKKFLKGQS